jgi:hypothetical protein
MPDAVLSPLPVTRVSERCIDRSRNHPIRWRMISALDRPLAEDAWVTSVIPDAATRDAWQAFLAEPRFAVSTDFAAWSVVAIYLHRNALAVGSLAQLFLHSMTRQTACWAVCRSIRRLFRLPGLSALRQWQLATGNTNQPRRLDAETGLRNFATMVDWADVPQRRRWEARLSDPQQFELSTCSRPFRRAQANGEFAGSADTERSRYAREFLRGVVALDARPQAEQQHFWRLLNRRERALARLTMGFIAAQFDTEVIETARANGVRDGLSGQRLNWLSGVPAGERRVRRAQALAAAPLLLPLSLLSTRSPTAEPIKAKGIDSATRLSDAIDRGAPLFAHLAQQTGLSERTVRHLRVAALREHHLASAAELDRTDRRIALLSWLDLIPVGQWPQQRWQWMLWIRVTTGLARQVRMVQMALGPLGVDAPDADDDVNQPGGDLRADAAVMSHRFYRALATRRWKLSLGLRHDGEWELDTGFAMQTVGLELRGFLKALRERGAEGWRADGRRGGERAGAEDAPSEPLEGLVCAELER